MRYLKEYGAQLVALGYAVIPIPPGTKGPRRPGWQKIEATPELISKWTANGSADDGIGILAAHTPAVDLDIMDADVAERMLVRLESLFDVDNIRVGMAPKILIPFRCDEPFKKLSSATYYDALTDTDNKVEILAEGQQWVAYHEHPDTRQPYTWTRGGLLDLPRDNLPVLSRDAALAVVQAFEDIAAELVASGQWEKKTHIPKAEPKPVQPVDPLMDWKPQIDFKTLKSALAKVPNKGRDELDYDQWRDVIFAIHRETNGADHGLQLAHAWSARSAKHDPVFLDERVWPYINSDKPGAITGLTILKHAREHGWRTEDVKPERVETGKLVKLSDFAQLRPISWLVKGILPAAEIAICYGASGSGKSFFVLDMVAAIARGIEWRGRRTKQCQVVYIAAEGATGFRGRTVAYGLHHKVDLSTMPFYVLPSPLDLADGYTELSSLIDGIGGAGLVVVDTLAATTPGMDENTGKDMGRAIDACRQIHAATGAMVLLIHHSGKNADQGARGWSGLRAACDAEFHITQEGADRAAKVTKQKDGEDGQGFGFQLKVVNIGEDEDGDPITSCVANESEVVTPLRSVRVSAEQKYILEVFEEALGMSDAMTADELIEAVIATQKREEKKVSTPFSVGRSLKNMIEKNMLEEINGKILHA